LLDGLPQAREAAVWRNSWPERDLSNRRECAKCAACFQD
jgi:hypothetical protein